MKRCRAVLTAPRVERVPLGRKRRNTVHLQNDCIEVFAAEGGLRVALDRPAMLELWQKLGRVIGEDLEVAR